MGKLNISILPAGAWGTALAVPLSDNGHHVKLYFRHQEDADHFNQEKENTKRLPKIKFNGRVCAISNLEEALEDADVLVLACDCAHVRNFFTQIKPLLKNNTKVLCVSKGIEEDTNLCMSEVLEQMDPQISSKLAVLSGPNFAIEVGKRLPTLTVIASKNKEIAQDLQKIFSSENFRIYTQDDVVGVELGGALKNVIAIGVGIGDGLRYGENGRAALITRGIAEMIKLGVEMGADELTFAGLSGMGDLILTCTSGKSRNYKAGLRIGRGVNPKELIESDETIEGLFTVRAAHELAKAKNIEVPIMEMVYKIVYKGLKPRKGFKQLMELELSSEDGNESYVSVSGSP
ncbi:glycerol-3-phosphate dehydrogenase [Candidatus Daviesbacteria bacterium RIFCSPLOWO2_01_FULL_39_12]|uniref:Glycerol-3-phosphate dehydrogenase [NAD(P)+] n=1 Tax=Candidatus Daviesbacteria bacterium RIFCSPLOWO2_01_FULL_39_12 TaxID=1797785 RepID=A0A1F5KNX7_9BACT|nr:MAG: glycerol-3-phosphate dehydrogenase [Candidatus Daviesbacteria bacterium RIFCSPLOWO2_01_FULL_39_12]